MIGTAAGVVKRVNPDYPLNLDQWSAIKLKDGDRVVGVGAAPDAAELVMVSSDAKLLHFPRLRRASAGPHRRWRGRDEARRR